MTRQAAVAGVIAALALTSCGRSTSAGDTSSPPRSTTPPPQTRTTRAGTAPAPPPRGIRARLQIDYQPHNNQPQIEHWTLSCGARAAGTHPQPARACAELAAHPDALTTGRSEICPMIIVVGDPDATVIGTVNETVVNLPARPQCPAKGWGQLHTLITGR